MCVVCQGHYNIAHNILDHIVGCNILDHFVGWRSCMSTMKDMGIEVCSNLQVMKHGSCQCSNVSGHFQHLPRPLIQDMYVLVIIYLFSSSFYTSHFFVLKACKPLEFLFFVFVIVACKAVCWFLSLVTYFCIILKVRRLRYNLVYL